jgi:hypothetical protein
LRKEFDLLMARIVFATVLVSTVPAVAQQTADPAQARIDSDSALPNAPSSQMSQSPRPAAEQTPSATLDPTLHEEVGPIPPLLTGRRLSTQDRFSVYVHQAFGPPALIFPAFGAAIRMAHPPAGYPHDWVDGGGAFGRLYGSALATQTAKRTAKFLTEELSHEDPRYLPAAHGSGFVSRVGHAVGFTFVDRSDSGHPELAFSNFASATAGGFVGMAYLPDGFNNASHAGQRVGTEFLGIVISNIAREFAPQLAPVVQKLHIPRIVPAWWVPESPQHP